jgi:hypothetical protein
MSSGAPHRYTQPDGVSGTIPHEIQSPRFRAVRTPDI